MEKEEARRHIQNLAGDYKCWDERLSHEEALVLCDMLDKLAEYKGLEEQGKLLKLPCKAGQKVYLLQKDIKRIIDGEITSITISEFASGMRIFVVDDNRYTDASFDKIGEIVFFTQEAAEAALKEL